MPRRLSPKAPSQKKLYVTVEIPEDHLHIFLCHMQIYWDCPLGLLEGYPDPVLQYNESAFVAGGVRCIGPGALHLLCVWM